MKAICIKQKKAVELLPQMQTAPGNLENRMGAEPTSEHDLLRTLIDNLPDYIYVKDRESRFLINNLAHVRILGATHPDEVAGRTDFDYFPKEIAEKFFADEQALMQSGQMLDCVESVVDKTTGKLRWLQTTKITRRDGSGKVIGLIGISRDITVQKRAEEALRQSRDELEQQVAERTAQLSQERLLLRTLIDNLPDSVYAKDTAGRKTLANPADLKNLRCKTEAEAIGKSDFDLFPKDIAEKFWADDVKVIRGEPITNREEFFFDEGGRKRWLLTSKLPLRDSNGALVGLVGIGRDITDRKQAEESLFQERLLLRTLIDNLPDLVFVKDPQSRFIVVNTACAQQLGTSRPEEVLGKSDADFVAPELAAQYRADEQALMQSGRPVHKEERTQHKTLGEMHWSLTTKIPLKDAAGNVAGLMGIARDITAIKEAEAKLDQIHKQLLETSRQAGMAEVATSVLHNVGNVLNSVNVASSCVADGLRNSKAANLSKIVALLREHEADLGHFITNDPKGKQLPGYLAQLAGHLAGEQTDALEKLDRLQKNIEHIREIVAMQQNYAKTSGVLESLPIVDLVEDAVRMNAGSMERHNIKMLREYSETPLVLVEKHKVLQILVNLISNAKHACNDSEKPDKQIILRVANEKERIKISVIDNGVGIPAENMTRIFNYGFTTRKDGHGFGLHNGALAAKGMGGSLAAFSEGPGRGAAFTLELPIQKQKANL
jgi:PAS domain S-box-containing protein